MSNEVEKHKVEEHKAEKNKVIIIKLKSPAIQKVINYFEDSYNIFSEGKPYSKNDDRYYNFDKEDKEDMKRMLTLDKNYLFLAVVYEDDEDKAHKDNPHKFIKTFLGAGLYYKDYKESFKIKVKYRSEENHTTESLRKLLYLDIVKDFNDTKYAIVESSEYLFNQIDFIINEPYSFPKNDGNYKPLPSENGLDRLAQRNEYCRRQYNLLGSQGERGEFQRDYERIVHSKAFRRMVDKAQVFSAAKGDYYRTRMTHSQAVAQIARGIAAELKLNLNLTEAIALGHDLGHTPFGHQGERTLNDILCDKIKIIKNPELFHDNFGGFKHNYQSVRVASVLEESYFEIDGMDLSYQTLEGMLKHTKLKEEFSLKEFINADGAADVEKELKVDVDFCSTLEGQIVAIADEIAQRGHDLDDALSSGIMSLDDFKKYMEFNKLESLKKEIDPLLDQMEKVRNERRRFNNENELINSRIVSGIIGYFIKDVIKTSRAEMDNYPDDKFKENGFSVDKKIIDFSGVAAEINKFLEKIIANKVINSSEVVLFDNNGATIVGSLFKAYYNNPRLLHKGTLRRIYTETRRVTQNVVDFELGDHDVIRKEIEYISKRDLETESEELRNEYIMKRRVLVRNICDYISGMTDTYAINEYRRIEKEL